MAVERGEGVESAEFSYDEASGVVTYDPEKTNPEEFLAELEHMTGFVGQMASPEEMER